MNYIKDVQSTPTTCAASFLDELEKHIFYIFQNAWRHITARPPPPPLKMMSQTVTEAWRNFWTAPKPITNILKTKTVEIYKH